MADAKSLSLDCRLHLSILWLTVFILTACTGSHVRLQQSLDIAQTFERREILPDHRYYTTGPEARPTAILAVHRSYSLKPGLWRPVDMTSEHMAQLVDAMTDQLGFTPAVMGAVIIDPEGRPAGAWYSLRSHTTVRFEPDNVIVVSLPSQNAVPLLMNTPGRPAVRR